MKHGITDAETTRAAIRQADVARSDAFEIRNRLDLALKEMVKTQEHEGPILSMQHCELQRAVEAAHKAADESAKQLGILHRNLMTLLGYHVDAEGRHPVLVGSTQDLENEAARLERELGKDNLAMALARAHRDERELHARLASAGQH